jgi:hypothetical protein
MRSASAAEAAADKLRNERRDAEERLRSLLLAIIHLVAAILPQNQRQIRPQIMSDSRPIFAAGSSVNLCVPCGSGSFVLTFGLDKKADFPFFPGGPS